MLSMSWVGPWHSGLNVVRNNSLARDWLRWKGPIKQPVDNLRKVATSPQGIESVIVDQLHGIGKARADCVAKYGDGFIGECPIVGPGQPAGPIPG